NLVARGRDLSLEQVERVAQGRVWLGLQAVELGLVDELGDQQTAITRAAELAGVERWSLQRIEPPLTPREILLRELFGNLARVTGGAGIESGAWPENGRLLPPLLRRLGETWQALQSLDDPRHSYALCLGCAVVP